MTPDVNVLVAASRADHVHHVKAQQWLHSALENARSGTALGLLGTVLASYLRLVTHPKVFAQPTPVATPSPLLTRCCSSQALSCWPRKTNGPNCAPCAKSWLCETTLFQTRGLPRVCSSGKKYSQALTGILCGCYQPSDSFCLIPRWHQPTPVELHLPLGLRFRYINGNA